MRSTRTTGTPAALMASSASGAASIQAPLMIRPSTFWLSRSSTLAVSLAASPSASVEMHGDVRKGLGLILDGRVHADEIGAAERQIDDADLDRPSAAAGRGAEAGSGQRERAGGDELAEIASCFSPLLVACPPQAGRTAAIPVQVFFRLASTATRMIRPFRNCW